MHVGVKMELDKSSALELPAFEPEEIDFWLNNAIKKFVKTRYSGLNSKTQSFEETQKRIDDLRTLVYPFSPNSLSSGSATYPNSYYAEFPMEGSGVGNEDYWFTIQEECEITIGDDSGNRVGITECTTDEYRQQIDDPYSEHILHYNTAKPLRLTRYNGVFLVSDGAYSVTDYFLMYLKKPDEVVYSTGADCDLPEHTHDEIVRMAASMMLENIEQPRYKTHMNEVATME